MSLAEHGGDRTELPALSSEELARYSRHLLLPQVGVEGQRRIKAARVLIVGAGGLGSPAALYLAAAGVGRLGLVDFDEVDASNLQRQILHGTRDVGRPKIDSARDRLADVNPHVHVETHGVRLTAANALGIIEQYDLVLDGSDNFATRYLVNDACVLLGRVNVYAGVMRFDGQASVFSAPDGPCYRCLFPDPPPAELAPNCAEAGVFGVLPGLLGVIQATEALKLILGVGDPLIGRLLTVDALGMRMRTIAIPRNPECPACGTRIIRELIDYDEFCNVRRSDSTVPEITPQELAERMRARDDLQLLDVRELHEWESAHIAEARLVPLGTLESAIPSLDRDRDIVVHCQGGSRSTTAVRRLQAAGFPRVWNLAGGIERWRREQVVIAPRG